MPNVLPFRRNRFQEPTADVRSPDPKVPEARSSAVESRVLVERVHLGSLAWMALRVALIVLATGASGVLIIVALADTGGYVRQFESFMRSIGFRDFHVA